MSIDLQNLCSHIATSSSFLKTSQRDRWVFCTTVVAQVPSMDGQWPAVFLQLQELLLNLALFSTFWEPNIVGGFDTKNLPEKNHLPVPIEAQTFSLLAAGVPTKFCLTNELDVLCLHLYLSLSFTHGVVCDWVSWLGVIARSPKSSKEGVHSSILGFVSTFTFQADIDRKWSSHLLADKAVPLANTILGIVQRASRLIEWRQGWITLWSRWWLEYCSRYNGGTLRIL